MDFLFGIKGRDFVMVCSDTCASQQIITIKHDEDKLVPIDSHKLIGISGASCAVALACSLFLNRVRLCGRASCLLLALRVPPATELCLLLFALSRAGKRCKCTYLGQSGKHLLSASSPGCHAVHAAACACSRPSHSSVRMAGEPGDRVQFSEFIIANVRLYALRNDFPLSTPAVANFTRCELAEALRKVRARAFRLRDRFVTLRSPS